MQLRLIINDATRLLDKTLRQWATAFNVMGVEIEEGEVMLSHLNEEVTDILYRGYYGTSANSLTISAGVQTFDTQAGLGYVEGQRIRLTNAQDYYMEGVLTSYVGNAMSVTVDYRTGSGSYSSWTLSPTTEQRVPEGGTTGQVLVKGSNTDYDVTWAAASAGGGDNSDYNNSFFLMGG